MNFKIISTILTFIVFLNFSTICFSLGKTKECETKDLKARNGLPNFFHKAIQGDTIKVAYLGGSITAQDGWRVYSLEWLNKQFPKSRFIEVNAAIGGTGSDFGVFRLHDQVLKFNPDLVFVEFAVNDGSTPTDKVIRAIEGIVRQIWQYNPKTDICFVYTIKEDFLQTEQKGLLPTSVMAMEKVADYYQIPTINFGLKVSKMVSSNQLIFTDKSKELNGIKVFSPDGVHPYLETGHNIYFDILRQSFEAMITGNKLTSKKHILSKPLTADNFSNAKMIDINSNMLSMNWEIILNNDKSPFSGFGNFMNTIGKGTRSGETLTINFKGRAIGAYDIMGPDAGRVVVEVDGLVRDTISIFDEYCTYRRMNYFVIDNLENKKHQIVFRLLCEPFDKLEILKRRDNVMKNPDEYVENNWYVGKILIDGNVL